MKDTRKILERHLKKVGKSYASEIARATGLNKNTAASMLEKMVDSTVKRTKKGGKVWYEWCPLTLENRLCQRRWDSHLFD